MADIDPQADLQPLRRLDQQIKATGDAVESIIAESAINGWLQQLTALPEFVDFDPFAVTTDWPAEANPAMTQSAARTASRTQVQPAAIDGNLTGFVDRLSEQSRRRSRLKLLNSETLAANASMASFLPSVAAQLMPTLATAEDVGRPSDPVALDSPAAYGSSGAWLALLEIDSLVNTLESIDSTNQQARGVKSTASTAVVVASTMAKTMSDTTEQSAESAFAALVSQLWQQQTVKMVADNSVERTEQQSAHPTESAVETQPRAHSWLLPSGSATLSPSVPQSVGQTAPAAPAALLNPGTTAATTQPRDPLEALNRALIEQAWLRGVDLT